jgi:hypothetical protein
MECVNPIPAVERCDKVYSVVGVQIAGVDSIETKAKNNRLIFLLT